MQTCPRGDMVSETNRVRMILDRLGMAYPDAPITYLNHKNAFEMLIATILSAHTTDASVNAVTPALFAKFPDPKAMSRASVSDLIEIIRPCGTFNRKSRFILETARALLDRFGGEVPRSMDDLVTLPGVSRKTANVVLSTVFDINTGIVVDTHIRRVTQRLGISSEKTPQKIERDLLEIVPGESRADYARLIGTHGRRTCRARRPDCDGCVIRDLCDTAGTWK